MKYWEEKIHADSRELDLKREFCGRGGEYAMGICVTSEGYGFFDSEGFGGAYSVRMTPEQMADCLQEAVDWIKGKQ